ncbi:3-methyladenine DNA glycosylase [Longivirga aurantiaca]|uniref:3-methyladenine DNA glycosylase n=1 Tax=Longivirga aurantiaca TaxID=1837743 RepID=A0ABW1SXU4_9ACTN
MTVSADPRLVPLAEDDWRARAAAHAERVDSWTAPRLERAQRGEKHPVDDFLFTYYPTRPGQLRRWHPGLGIALLGGGELGSDAAYTTVEIDGAPAATVDPRHFARRRDGLAWVEGLVRSSADRPARLGCFGLHEWAMVYGLEQEEVRHESWALRLTPDEIRDVVDDNGLRCTHFDAFRFFTPDAVPLNELAPTRETQPGLDQPGCLHATMDLYKWAAKYDALVGSDLVADCFALAREARRLDMEAAPYDLAALGYAPVRVETPEGRAEYVRRQRELMDLSAPLRSRLARALASGLAAVDATA